jgi:hypothetical protein
MNQQEKGKKQVLLRLAPDLWQAIAQWADDDFRSINGQIEYLLTESLRRHRRDTMLKKGLSPAPADHLAESARPEREHDVN